MPRTSLAISTLVLFGILAIALWGDYGSALTASLTSPINHEKKTGSPFKDRVVSTTLEEYARWSKGKTRENDPRAAERLRSYWEMGEIGIPTNEELADSLWQERRPWSAVFISWIMKKAGAGNAFRYAHAHASYIVWARDNAALLSEPSFAAYDVKDKRSAWPEPGDLICLNREENNHSLDELDTYHATHCDVIVEVNREMNMMVTIGGNLAQTVNKRIVWLDANGYIDPTREWVVIDDKNPYKGPQHSIFAIIKISPQLQP
jgi:hypothetical protein